MSFMECLHLKSKLGWGTLTEGSVCRWEGLSEWHRWWVNWLDEAACWVADGTAGLDKEGCRGDAQRCLEVVLEI